MSTQGLTISHSPDMMQAPPCMSCPFAFCKTLHCQNDTLSCGELSSIWPEQQIVKVDILHRGDEQRNLRTPFWRKQSLSTTFLIRQGMRPLTCCVQATGLTTVAIAAPISCHSNLSSAARCGSRPNIPVLVSSGKSTKERPMTRKVAVKMENKPLRGPLEWPTSMQSCK